MPAGRRRKPRSEAKTVPIWTAVDMPTKADLDNLARKKDVSLAWILRQAVSEYLQKTEAA